MNSKQRCKLRRKLKREQERKAVVSLGRTVETNLLNCGERVVKAISMPTVKSAKNHGSQCLSRVYMHSIGSKTTERLTAR